MRPGNLGVAKNLTCIFISGMKMGSWPVARRHRGSVAMNEAVIGADHQFHDRDYALAWEAIQPDGAAP